MIELGVPFSDPVADGPVIQRASERALRNHVTLADIIDLARAFERKPRRADYFFVSQSRSAVRVAKFCAAAADAGIDGALITDLPVEESREYCTAMRSRTRRYFSCGADQHR